MSSPDDDLNREFTKAELEQAWSRLQRDGVTAIANISLGEIGRIVAGNPNYSPAERRMAGGLLMLRSRICEVAT